MLSSTNIKLSCHFFYQATDGKDYEIMLIEKLTKDYKKGARPVHSNKEAVVVYYDLKVNKLEKLVSWKLHIKTSF